MTSRPRAEPAKPFLFLDCDWVMSLLPPRDERGGPAGGATARRYLSLGWQFLHMWLTSGSTTG